MATGLGDVVYIVPHNQDLELGGIALRDARQT
jgi:hypothetical protein